MMQLRNLIWQIAFTCESHCELKETISNAFLRTHFIHPINCFQSMVDLPPMGIVLLIPFMANLRCLNSSPRAPSLIQGGTGFRRIGNASKKEAIEDRQSQSLETLNASHAPRRPSDGGGVHRKRGRRGGGGGEEASSRKSDVRCLGGQPDQVKT